MEDVIKDVEAISEELENLEINKEINMIAIEEAIDLKVKKDEDTNLEAKKDMKVINEEVNDSIEKVNEFMEDKEGALKDMLVMLAILPASSEKEAVVRMVMNYLDKLWFEIILTVQCLLSEFEIPVKIICMSLI